MTESATIDLSEAATVVVPPPKADVPVLGTDDIVQAPPPRGQRAAELLDGLIAWHNRMPWAKRLRPEQVGQAGVVRFAFKQPQGGSGDAATLEPLFTPERLVAGQSAKQLLAFVRLHGLDTSPAPADWPLRELAPAAGAGADVHWRYLLSAAYPGAYGSVPLRALMGQPAKAGGKVSVAGRRGLSLPRVGGAVGLLVGLVLAAVLGLKARGHDAAAAAPLPAASAASAVEPKAPASAAAAASEVALAAEAAAPASAAASAAGAAASAATPGHEAASAAPAGAAPASQVATEPAHAAENHAPAAAAKGHEPPAAATHAEPAPAAKPELAAKPPEPAASQAAAPAERPLPKPRPTIRPIHASPETYDPVAQASAKANGQPAPPVRGPSYALVTAVSEQPESLLQLRRRLRQAMGREGEDLKLELQPAPGGQVLALWPIPSRDSATRLADTLRQAGIRMRVVEF